MGWGSASGIFSVIIEAAKKHIPNETERKEFYKEVYPVFADEDWDTEDECFDDDHLFKEVYDDKWNT